MKAKNQAPISSEIDAKEKLIVYVFEYLTRVGAKGAAASFLEEIRYDKEITINNPDGPGFLANWWSVFWDLYCAAPDKRTTTQAEPSNEAKAFIEFSMRPVMSPHQTSPPQPPYMNAGSRYALPPPNHQGPPPTMRHHGPPPQMNLGPPRMPMSHSLPPPQQMGVPPPQSHSHGPPPPMSNGPHHGPPPPQMMGNAPNPRYAPHPGHITPVPGGPEPGPSPGLVNRMTPTHRGSPHTQIVGGPPPGSMPLSGGIMHPTGGPSGQQQMPPSGPPPQAMQQRGGGNGPGGGWQGGYSMHSPADQQCFMPGPPGPPGQPNEFGGMMMGDGSSMMEMKSASSATNNNSNNNTPANPQQDEYVMPGAYQGGDAGSEIRKLKESLESDTNEGDQTGFDMNFSDAQGKW